MTSTTPISFSVRITVKDGKKVVAFPPAWAKLTAETCTQFQVPSNGLVYLTGNKNGFIVIDADEVKAVLNGQPIPGAIISELEASCEAIVKTPNGRHFYFKTEETYTSSTNILWNNTVVPFLDIRGDGGCIIAPPSHYIKAAKTLRYEWMKGGIDTVAELPASVSAALAIKATQQTIYQEYIEVSNEDIITELLTALPIKVWDSYDTWIQIGMILYNCGMSCDVWDSFSKQSSHWKSPGCRDAWRSFAKGPLTIGSLWRLVKLYSPDNFVQLQRKHINIVPLLQPEHLSLAKLVYALCPSDYAYCSNTQWYERMENNVWKSRGEEPLSLQLRIAETIKKAVHAERSRAMYKVGQIVEDGSDEAKLMKQTLADQLKLFLKVSAAVENHSFVQSTQKFLKSYYTVDEFYKKLDSNRSFFAFTNGVYDLSTGLFRGIIPEDFISTTCGYPRRAAGAMAKAEVRAAFAGMFAAPADCSYLLKTMAYHLSGDTKFQELHIWQGRGANGKGITIKMLQKVFGDYMRTIPTSYFTQPSEGKGAPLPELAMCRATRLLFASEPEADTSLQVGFCKLITGNDTISVRALYREPIAYQPQFSIVILANEVPKLSKLDKGIQRRLRVVPFPFEFLDEVRCENHRPVDRSLEGKAGSEEWRDALMEMLLEIYADEVRDATALTYPLSVQEASKEYLDENNPLALWLPDHIITNAPDTERMTATDIFNLFKSTSTISLNVMRLGLLLSSLGFHSIKTNGRLVYKGFVIKG